MSKYYSKFYSDMLRANFDSRESEKDLSDALMTFILLKKIVSTEIVNFMEIAYCEGEI